MLEESRMDKKSLNRSTQPQSRAPATDCKKSSELTHKPLPRNNKKREGVSSTPKNDAYRKNVPSQRGRGPVDRRPRPRDSPGYTVAGAQNTGIDEDEPEIGSVFVPGSKKQNLNHLLNFMLPTRGPTERRGMQPRRQNQLHRASFKHEHDLFLRAYCQFVVKENGEYKANLLDPDVPIKWEQIEEVVVRSTGRSECPICLGAPVAGRVGLCGHVYCWPCVLHYSAVHEKQPPPCPVCTTPMLVNDMKPTRMVQWASPAEEVTMRLVRRLRGSTTLEVPPARGQIMMETIPDHILPLHKINDAPYCKLFSATKQQVQDILEREEKEIKAQILNEIDTTEVVYMEQALTMLKEKNEKAIICFEEPEIKPEPIDEVPIVYEKLEMNGNKMDWFDVDEEGVAAEAIQNQFEDLNIQSNVNSDELLKELAQSNLNPDAHEFNQVNQCDDSPLEEIPAAGSMLLGAEPILDNSLANIDKQNQAKYFYFYQADDGQQVFLNSLNVRVLNASWGSLAASPPVIRGRVLHRETLPLSDQTRKHMPCTAHLPLHCSFDIVEMDLQPPYVTPEALQNFAEELDRRARIRARAERDERRRERACRRAMEGPPRPDFSSDLVFPPAQPTYSSPPLEPSPLSTFEASPSASYGSPQSALSFAKMASTSGTWRVRKPSPPPPPPEEAGAPRALVLSDAIEAALQAAPPPSGKKNKKKSTKKLLFATGMQHSP